MLQLSIYTLLCDDDTVRPHLTKKLSRGLASNQSWPGFMRAAEAALPAVDRASQLGLMEILK